MSRMTRIATALALAVTGAAWGAAAAGAWITASSTHGAEFAPAHVLDGDYGTRWASASGADGEWLQLDLGAVRDLDGLTIRWERAHAEDYEVQMSPDGAEWTTVHRETAGGGVDRLDTPGARGRYVRIVCHRPGPEYPLYSIWEIALDGEAGQAVAHWAAQEEARKAEQRAALRAKLQARLPEAVVFATRPLYPDGHWYANISYYAQDADDVTYAKGGGLYVWDVAQNTVRALLEDPEGTVRDPAVHYDGQRIVFAYRPGGARHFHLYAINADGSDLRQITQGAYDDFEPAWLPDGDLVFVSTRCRRWVNCWVTQVATVHRCRPDGTGVTPLSANLEHDNTPWPLPDGRILYMRWEYVDRSQVDYHHLWTMNPDGTNQQTFFGNMHPGGVFIDAKPVPGANEVVMINSPGHGAREHAGHVALVHVAQGPDQRSAMRNLTAGRDYRDPYPLNEDLFLAAKGPVLTVVNRDGTEAEIFALEQPAGGLQLHEPRPLYRPRPRERVIPPRVDYAEATGQLFLSRVHEGRNMEGVAPGEIASLLVVEALPKPINYTGGMDPLTYGGSFTLERVLGTVPVEADGSANIALPANRALFFVALDQNGASVKRMQSFLTLMPGETTSCVGCHEERVQAVSYEPRPTPKALLRPPSVLEPIADLPEVLDYPRDIQPILDAHCLPCHDYTPHDGADHGPRSGGVILSGDHGPMFSHSYAALTIAGQIRDGRNEPRGNRAPRTIGASASPVFIKARDGHHGVKLSGRELKLMRYWLETGAAYPGTYGALGGGAIGGYHVNRQIETDYDWPASKAAADAIERRCTGCHEGAMSLPRFLSDENGLSFWRPFWRDPRLERSRHLVFNLTRPEQSLVLLAPLAKHAGGYGLCAAKPDQKPIFANKNDEDYQKVLAMCAAGRDRLAAIKRFDMPGFEPPAPYVREMQRYGVLPADLPPGTPVDPYACDLAYWASFEQEAAMKHPAYQATSAMAPGGAALSSAR